MQKFTLSILFILLLAYPGLSQDNVKIIQTLDSLQYGASFPENILESKSVVLMHMPAKSQGPQVRGDWQKLAELTQPGFKKAGLDVVTYYHVEDIFSGRESYQAFIKNFKERELEHVIFVISNHEGYRIILTKIASEEKLIAGGQNAWETRNADLDQAMSNLYRASENSQQNRENLLILEVPEFGEMPKVITGRRGEYYDLNFSSEKLAIPVFADTALISQVMAQYPYEYGYVNPTREEKKVRADGHQYILYYVHATGKAVKEMLEYSITDSETAYVSEAVKDGQPRVNSYNINMPVYKFYIKHIYTGNVFLGKKWDAAPTWQQALANYIDNLRTELIRK